jgi:hypothetical protein
MEVVHGDNIHSKKPGRVATSSWKFSGTRALDPVDSKKTGRVAGRATTEGRGDSFPRLAGRPRPPVALLRQRESKRSAITARGLYPDRSAMLLDDSLANG